MLEYIEKVQQVRKRMDGQLRTERYTRAHILRMIFQEKYSSCYSVNWSCIYSLTYWIICAL